MSVNVSVCVRVSAVPVMGVGPRQEIQEILLKVCKGGFLLTCSVELETHL